MKIVVYTKPNCIQCRYTKERLDGMGLVCETIDVTQDDDAAEAVKHMGFGDHPQMPVVVVTGSQRTEQWAGFKIDKLRGLKETGNY